jgi:hypothetical protein
VNGRPSFIGDRERQLRFSRFSPFVESVRRNQAAPFGESLPERGLFIDGLSSGVDRPVSDLGFFEPSRFLIIYSSTELFPCRTYVALYNPKFHAGAKKGAWC